MRHTHKPSDEQTKFSGRGGGVVPIVYLNANFPDISEKSNESLAVTSQSLHRRLAMIVRQQQSFVGSTVARNTAAR